MVLKRASETMARSRTRTTLLLAALAVTVCAPALAAPPEPAPAKTADEADVLFRKGNAAYDAGKPAEALPLYLAAWKLKQTHDIAGNMAQVELVLGKKRDAAEHIAFALAHFPPTGTAQDRREKMRKALDDLRHDIASLRVSVSLPGAEVTLDDKPIGRSPIDEELFVDPGRHAVRASLGGYADASEQVDAAKGSAQVVTVTLKAAAPPPPPPPVEPTPKAEPRSVVPGAVLGGVAGAALATGIGLMVVSAQKRSSAQDVAQSILGAHHSCVTGAGNFDPQCSQVASTTTTSDTLHNAGVGVLVGAGALAVASGLYFLWPAPRVVIAPAAGTSGGGLWVHGSF
jgi:hypothetical protein